MFYEFAEKYQFIYLVFVCFVLGLSGCQEPARDLWGIVPQESAGESKPKVVQSSVLPMGSKVSARKLEKMPLHFVENRGQVDGPVKYYVQGKDKSVYFTKEGVTFALKDRERAERWVMRLGFEGASEVEPIGQAASKGIVSYFKGSKEDWKTGIPTYRKLVYKQLWPGIDLVYEGTSQKLKYTFEVQPGADPRQVQLFYEGISKLSVKQSGALQVRTPAGTFEDEPPVAYQLDSKGKRVPVSMAYDVHGAKHGTDQHRYGFRVGRYDRNKTLYLDPAYLVYCGYIGGDDSETAYGVAADSSGNLYAVGYTYDTGGTFPTNVGPDTSQNGSVDAFITKVSSDGTTLLYSGFIGGSGDEEGRSVAVDSSGNAYVVGYTMSTATTFPETGGPDLRETRGGDPEGARRAGAGRVEGRGVPGREAGAHRAAGCEA